MLFSAFDAPAFAAGFAPIAAALAVFLSLIGGVLGRLCATFPSTPQFDRLAQRITSGLMLISALLANWVLAQVVTGGHAVTVHLADWISVGDFSVEWALRFDVLAAVMVAMVTTVSACVHLYAIGYMAEDPEIPRFMGYLSLFTFFMLMLVTSDNLIQMFFGWEGVGLSSYLLIGFWHQRASANNAAIKAFVVNRIGDLGFLLGIFATVAAFGSTSFDTIFATLPLVADLSLSFLGFSIHAPTLIAFLLFIGAMGKSAQLGLHVWLPDAMEGPTPVSALIHAATMVTAGVFMICRLSPLYELAPSALDFIAVMGVATSLFAAFVALTQNDIKRIVAYSTCSQLGYMFVAVGLQSYSAGMFHLITHAFFKALLFLGAGSVIHALSGEQDIRHMGGLRRHLRYTFPLLVIGNLALCGIFPFAGFFSKDAILEAAYFSHSVVAFPVYLGCMLVAVMTAFYSFRLLFLVFFGSPRPAESAHGSHDDHHDHGHDHDQGGHHPHESPPSMILPLLPLALGAVAGGFLLEPWLLHAVDNFWQNSLVVHDHHQEISMLVKWAPLFAALLGIFLAWVLYIAKPRWPAVIATRLRALYQLSYRKIYVDELYGWLIVRPLERAGGLFWRLVDVRGIDRLGPNGVAGVTAWLGRISLRWQSGLVYHYVIAMVMGLMVALSLQAYGQGDIRHLLAGLLR